MPREVRTVADLPASVRDLLTTATETRAARDDVLANRSAADARLTEIVATAQTLDSAGLQTAVKDLARIVARVNRYLGQL